MLKIQSDKSYNLRFRNTLLRIYISANKNEIVKEYSNRVINKTRRKFENCYDKLISIYYDVNLIYINMSDEEREVLDAIITLCY
jgi:hypothetical protein